MLKGDIFFLINCLSFVLWLSIGAAVAGLLWMRKTKPNLKRPIRVHTALPVIFLIGCVYLVVVPMITEPASTGIISFICFNTVLEMLKFPLNTVYL